MCPLPPRSRDGYGPRALIAPLPLYCTAGAQAMQKNKERVAQTFRAAFAAK